MPGGFVRIAENADARAVSLQRGAATADAWVLAHGPVGRDDVAADAGADSSSARHRLAAEPRRRQSVLGRPLRRTRGSDTAAGARLMNRVAEVDETTAPVIAALGSLLQIWNAVPERDRRRTGRRSSPAPLSPRGDLPGRCRARPAPRGRRLSDPRSLLARRLAGDQRSRHHDRHAADVRSRRERHDRARRGGACGSSPRSPVWRRKT